MIEIPRRAALCALCLLLGAGVATAQPLVIGSKRFTE